MKVLDEKLQVTTPFTEENGEELPKKIEFNIDLIRYANLCTWIDLDMREFRRFKLIVVNYEVGENLGKKSLVESRMQFRVDHYRDFALNLLILFARFLQLIAYFPWSTPCSIEYEEMKQKSSIFQVQASLKMMCNHSTMNVPNCGLANLGNTCYMNSAIQCLTHIPELNKWAQNYLTTHRTGSVTRAFTSLVQSMCSQNKTVLRPHELKYDVSRYSSIFADYQQKDAHEFINTLLNALHMELQEENQSSIVTDLFQIRTKSHVKCLRYNHTDCNQEIMYCLPLPLSHESVMNLDTLVDDFQKEEKLDGPYYCSSCDDLVDAVQKTTISSDLPPVVIVQLKRFPFDGTEDKLDGFVKYPVTNWHIVDGQDSSYDLYAVAKHLGTLKFGHYTAFALSHNNHWFHFNDSNFAPVSKDKIVTKDAYVLVYVRRK